MWEILRNPKYTGYQVWNRRARKTAGNRDNPPETWIWSEEPAHPAVVSKEEFEAVAARAAANRGSRQGAAPTRHQYLYRRALDSLGVDPLKVFFTNSILCHPGKNERTIRDKRPPAAAILACQERLRHEIEGTGGRWILAVGAVAGATVTGKRQLVSKSRC